MAILWWGDTPRTFGLGLIVPSYFSTTGQGAARWSSMNEAASRVPLIAILNPSNGPGSSPNSGYSNAVNSLRAAGGWVIGYVHTSYGARSLALVKQDVDRHRSFYNLDGIFVDEMTNNLLETNLTYYAELYSYVRGVQSNWFVMGNPGTSTREAYLTRPCADILVTFEASTAYSGYAPDLWTRNYSPTNFAHLCHSIPGAGTMTNYVHLAIARNAGWLYVTDDSLPNPWDTLPTYWTNQVNYMVETNRARLRLNFTGSQAMELHVKGIPGRYVMQTSSNLFNWKSVATNTTATGDFAVAMEVSEGATNQFYRTQQFVR